ncbi:unnamed protein product [Moneuplotes crassus]|uniref:Uncharacterized protein n=1 Tax=Euplotes crassus TaxID=5936 RepID=A0AAD2DAK0_EUPCR|nr:unnamed protein product [Moneuplotes crassus]
MRNKSKSKPKLATKRQLRKRDLSLKARKNKLRRRSVAAEKRKAIIENLKNREPLRKSRKRKWDCHSESSYRSKSRKYSISSSPKLKKKKCKTKRLDTNLFGGSGNKNRTFHKQDYFKGELKRAHNEILDLKSLLEQSNTALSISEKEFDLMKKEATTLKKKMKHYKYYKEKTKDYKEKLKKASKEIQELEMENNRLNQIFGDQSLIFNRDQCRKVKFQLKSITHSVTKLLNLPGLDNIISKELNLILDFCGRIMSEMSKFPTITVEDSKISECNSLSSKAVEAIGVTGLQKYKQLSENFSFNTSNFNREANNQTQISMKIENQLIGEPHDRPNKVRTSHQTSHSRTKTEKSSSRDEEEYRIRKINNELMYNSQEYSQQDSRQMTWNDQQEHESRGQFDESQENLKFENECLKNELFSVNKDFIPNYERVINDLQSQNKDFQHKISELERSNGWDQASEKMLKEMRKMQEAIDMVKHENEALRDERHMFQNQLYTLKNVNESQQKLIQFLNSEKENSDNENENNNEKSFYNRADSSFINRNHDNNFSPISEEENEFGNTLELEDKKITEEELDQKSDDSYDLDSQDDDKELNSIEKSRQSYNEIIGSFKNIHDKLEQWHNQRKLPDKEYGSLIQQETASFDNIEPENPQNKEEDTFLYEFEKHNSNTIESSYDNKENSCKSSNSKLVQKQGTYDSDKENICMNSYNNLPDSSQKMQTFSKNELKEKLR